MHTKAEQIRHVFALHGGQMTIKALVARCIEAGIFDQATSADSMAATCRRALRSTVLDEDTKLRIPFALPVPRRRLPPRS